MHTINPRQAHVGALATTLPNPELHTLLRGVDLDVWPGYPPTQLVPGLHQGGTEDHDVLSRRGDDFRRRGIARVSHVPVDGDGVLDVTAIDNLPSLMPVESSEDYAGQLLPSLLTLDALDRGVWGRAKVEFDRHVAGV